MNYLKRFFVCFLAVVIFAVSLVGCRSVESGKFGERLVTLDISDEADTIFVVLQDENGTSFCTYYAYSKIGDVWNEEFVVNGYVGRNGVLKKAYQRRAGDGTTPGGIYSLGEKFGIYDKPEGLDAAYTKVTEDCYWNGDSGSPTYNQHVHASEMPENWRASSSEHLIEYTQAYNYCTMINFNVDPTVPGMGSCIFLHCTSDGSTSSSGCVAIPEEQMIESLILMGEGNSYIVILENESDFEYYAEYEQDCFWVNE